MALPHMSQPQLLRLQPNLPTPFPRPATPYPTPIPQVSRSLVVDAQTGQSRLDDIRTSFGAAFGCVLRGWWGRWGWG